jgi:hypothetical protein
MAIRLLAAINRRVLKACTTKALLVLEDKHDSEFRMVSIQPVSPQLLSSVSAKLLKYSSPSIDEAECWLSRQ